MEKLFLNLKKQGLLILEGDFHIAKYIRFLLQLKLGELLSLYYRVKTD